jgi:hypothetical protein
MARPQNPHRRTPFRLELGSRLRELRAATCGHEASGRVRTEPLLSHLGRLPRHKWYNWERGMSVPVEAVLHLVARMNVSAEWLLSGEVPMFAGDDPPWAPDA